MLTKKLSLYDALYYQLSGALKTKTIVAEKFKNAK
jgi:hypothetical protein